MSAWRHLRFAASLALASLSPLALAAGGVVGSGTAASCTEVAFDTVLGNAQGTGGGIITFDCGAAPVAIPFSSYKTISAAIELRGGGRVTLTGGNSVPLFQVFATGRLTVRGITLARALGPAGAVENFGVFTMVDGRFDRNTSTGSGGAVDNQGVASFTNVVFDSNTAADHGGAIRSAGTRIDLVNVDMTANVAGSRGGALAIDAGVVATLELVRIFANQAEQGGGIRSVGTMTMRNVTLASNQATETGGGMYFASGSAEITRTIFELNRAGTLGGGLYQVSGSVAMRDVNLLVNVAEDSPGRGGAIRVLGGTLDLRNVGMVGNRALNGGGVAAAAGSGTWANVTFWANEADTPSGAAIEVTGGTFTVTNATVVSDKGVAINRTGGTLTFRNSAFASNGSGNTNCAQALVGATFSLSSDDTCGLGGGRDNRILDFVLTRLYNGGFTMTMMPVPTSPMIDGGSNALCPDADQRGVARPSGLACDIGAVERVAGEAVKDTAFEFYHAEFGHYFVTNNFNEALNLDLGSTTGWVRTGEFFDIYGGDLLGVSAKAAELARVCRFFSDVFAPKSSHFYAPEGLGCEGTKQNADWGFEGNVFNTTLPSAAGTCPDGGTPIYRLFNDGQGGAPNHRFTTSLDVRAQMIAKGFVPEGAGIGVGMCSPP